MKATTNRPQQLDLPAGLDDFTNTDLRVLSLSTEISQAAQQAAFLELCRRSMAKHPDESRRLLTA